MCVDMGPPTLAAADVPTTLEPTRPDGSVVAQVRKKKAQGIHPARLGVDQAAA